LLGIRGSRASQVTFEAPRFYVEMNRRLDRYHGCFRREVAIQRDAVGKPALVVGHGDVSEFLLPQQFALADPRKIEMLDLPARIIAPDATGHETKTTLVTSSDHSLMSERHIEVDRAEAMRVMLFARDVPTARQLHHASCRVVLGVERIPLTILLKRAEGVVKGRKVADVLADLALAAAVVLEDRNSQVFPETGAIVDGF